MMNLQMKIRGIVNVATAGCDDYKSRAAEGAEALSEEAAWLADEDPAKLDPLDQEFLACIAHMPDGYNCPNKWREWYSKI